MTILNNLWEYITLQVYFERNKGEGKKYLQTTANPNDGIYFIFKEQNKKAANGIIN
jgi:hypothetical protein